MMSSELRRSVWAQSISTPASFTASTMRRPSGGQALRGVVAATGHGVVAVVGEVDLAHTQIAKEGDHVGLLEQGQGAFEVEAHGQLPVGARASRCRTRWRGNT